VRGDADVGPITVRLVELDDEPARAALASLNAYLDGVSTLKQVSLGRVNDDTLFALARCSELTSFYQTGSLDISDAGVVALVKGCPLLGFLNLDGMSRVTDVAWIALAHGLPKLRILSANYCRLMTDKAVTEMAKHLRALESLEVNHCDLLTNVSLRALHFYLNGTLHEFSAGGTQIDDALARRWTHETGSKIYAQGEEQQVDQKMHFRRSSFCLVLRQCFPPLLTQRSGFLRLSGDSGLDALL
jgi:hypothetical protein